MKATTHKVWILLLGGAAAALAIGGLTARAGESEEKAESQEVKVAIPAAQVIASIHSAVATKAGNVQKVDVEKEDGKTLCEVSVLAEDGKVYDVSVDVHTNKVVEVENGDDRDED